MKLGQLPGELDPREFESNEDFDEWRDQWLGHLQKCAMYTRVGHYNHISPDIKTGEYEVCLTSRQSRTLFGDRLARSGKARRLGCGTFACAWDRGRGKVVKITADPDDVTALIEAQGLKHVVRLDKAYKLTRSGVNRLGEMVPLYGLIAEKVLPLDEMRTQWLLNFPTKSFNNMFKKYHGHSFLTPGEGEEDYEIEAPMKHATQEAVCYGDDDEYECATFIGEVVDTVEALAKRGINWSDVHEGNVGMARDWTWKILDLGISGEQARPTDSQAKPLRGRSPGPQWPLLGVALATLAGLGAVVYVGAMKQGVADAITRSL